MKTLIAEPGWRGITLRASVSVRLFASSTNVLDVTVPISASPVLAVNGEVEVDLCHGDSLHGSRESRSRSVGMNSGVGLDAGGNGDREVGRLQGCVRQPGIISSTKLHLLNSSATSIIGALDRLTFCSHAFAVPSSYLDQRVQLYPCQNAVCMPVKGDHA